MAIELAVGLVHHPILDRAGSIVATNVTNFDVHDIARACRVYGVTDYFIIHPSREQQMFVGRMLDHWRVGPGSKLNPKRKSALEPVKTADSLQDALRQWGKPDARVVTTHARETDKWEKVGFQALRAQLPEKPHFLVFGTGFGLADEVFESCDVLLEPIRGASRDDYRHLSVRSAVSICLDRLMGSC